MVLVRPQRGSQSVDALLNALSPYDVAQAVRSFVHALSPVRVHEMIAESLPRMDADERAQLAIAFGARNVPRGETSFDEPITDDAEILATVAAAGDSAPERYANFLAQNVRALHTLDRAVLDELLGPVVSRSPAAARFPSFKPRKPARPRSQLPAVWIASGLLYAASLAVALWISRGIIAPQPSAGSAPSTVALATSQPQPPAPAPAPRAVAPGPRPAHQASHHPRYAPPRHPSHAVATRPRPVFHAHRAPPAPRLARARTPFRVSGPPTLVQRARATVAMYLQSALRGSHVRIVGSSTRGDGLAKVDVEILARDGRYFGVYTVAFNGPATRITNKTVIPVSGPGRIP